MAHEVQTDLHMPRKHLFLSVSGGYLDPKQGQDKSQLAGSAQTWPSEGLWEGTGWSQEQCLGDSGSKHDMENGISKPSYGITFPSPTWGG